LKRVLLPMQSRPQRGGRAAVRVVAHEKSVLANEIRMKVTDYQVEGPLRGRLFHPLDRPTPAEPVHQVPLPQELGHPPNDTCAPNRMTSRDGDRFVVDPETSRQSKAEYHDSLLSR